MRKNINTYIGGLNNGRRSAERVAEALERRQGNGRPVNAFTFSDWVNDPEEVEKAMRGAGVGTHSAAARALQGANFSSAFMLNPPLPRRIGGLIMRGVLNPGRMFIPGVGLHAPADLLASASYIASSTAELASHPIANLGQLRQISEFDAVRVATGLKSAGKDVDGIVWTDNDMFFKPSEADLDGLRVAGVPYQIVSGEHDEVVLRPDQFFEEIDL